MTGTDTPVSAATTPPAPRDAGERPGRPPALRHPRDVLRLLVGLAVLGLTWAAAADGGVGRFEEDLFRLVNNLPHLLRWPLYVVMQAGALVAVPVVAGLALALRRFALARDLAVAGVSAWLLAKVVKGLVERPRPAGVLAEVDLHLPEPGWRFPSGHVSVAAALVAVAWPYLTPRLRRLALAVVGAVGLAQVYTGVHLPWDVLGGAALGLAVGATVHLLFGAPGGRPEAPAVRRALEHAGVAVADIRAPQLDARGSTPFLVLTQDGRELFVKAIGRTQRDADVLYKAWRFLVHRRPADDFPLLTPKQDVQHEAHLSMLAERAGVRTPPVVLDTGVGDGTVLLVQQRIRGRNLADLPPAAVTDELLADLWAQVARLHAARIAHRDLRLANVLVDDDARPWLIDFGAAEATAEPRRMDQDVAELLAATAVVVGPGRACRAACARVGTAAVAAALPLLQPLALTTATRRQVATQPGMLDELRKRAAATSGGTAPELERLPRLRLRTAMFVVAGGVALYLFLPSLAQLPAVAEAVDGARWEWLAAALAASVVGYVGAAVALIGVVDRPLPPLPVVVAQLAASFANRFTPAGLGALAVNVRYLMRHGLDRSAALAAVALTATAGVVVHVTALLVVVPLAAGSAGAFDGLRSSLPPVAVLTGLAAALAAAGILLLSPIGKRRILPFLRQALGNLARTLRQPRRASALLVGSAGVTLSYVATLAAAARAFGVDLSFLEVAAAYLAGAALAAAAPTPGGLGAAEAALAAGFIALGADAAPAVAAVLAFRLVTFWLPIVPGFLAWRWLRRRDAL